MTVLITQVVGLLLLCMSMALLDATSMLSTSTTQLAAAYPKGQVIGLYWKKKNVLNDVPADEVVSPQSPKQLVSDIRNKMLGIKSSSITADGKVDYASIKQSESFASYLSLARQLQGVDLSTLSTAGKKSSLINIYNCLIIHAIINGLLDVKGGTLARLKLYASASYNIGGIEFSLNDIENGLLRGNRKSAVPFTGRPFPQDADPRRKIMLDCDARIHFALNCGAVSCPPIGVYTEESIDDELALATEGFLDQSVAMDAASKTLTLSMLFSWYRQDFGTTDSEVFAWIQRNASPELREKLRTFAATVGDLSGLKITYATYNWDLNDI